VSADAPPKVVLDTNILCRFVMTPTGFSSRLYRAIWTGQCTLVTSEPILAEVWDVLGRPRVKPRVHLSDAELQAILDAYRKMAIVVPGDYEVFVVTADPKDNPILACALEARADYVVTDDREHLLPIKHWRGIQIVSVPGFLKILRNR
jgi:putative PIN family toxin of toxin-antitoxin system